MSVQLSTSSSSSPLEPPLLVLLVEAFDCLDPGNAQVLLRQGLIVEDASSELGRRLVEEAAIPVIG